MRLPNGEHARIDESKITGYLLAEESETGRSKARFFAAFGFSVAEWKQLKLALMRHAEQQDVVHIIETGYGKKYIVEGRLETPDRRNPYVRTIWLIEQGSTIPRLITAYPVKGEQT